MYFCVFFIQLNLRKIVILPKFQTGAYALIFKIGKFRKQFWARLTMYFSYKTTKKLIVDFDVRRRRRLFRSSSLKVTGSEFMISVLTLYFALGTSYNIQLFRSFNSQQFCRNPNHLKKHMTPYELLNRKLLPEVTYIIGKVLCWANFQFSNELSSPKTQGVKAIPVKPTI